MKFFLKICYILSICREIPTLRICTKFCTVGGLADIITCFKFGVDRLRCFKSAKGRILPLSIDLAGRHQHRAALLRACDKMQTDEYILG